MCVGRHHQREKNWNAHILSIAVLFSCPVIFVQYVSQLMLIPMLLHYYLFFPLLCKFSMNILLLVSSSSCHPPHNPHWESLSQEWCCQNQGWQTGFGGQIHPQQSDKYMYRLTWSFEKKWTDDPYLSQQHVDGICNVDVILGRSLHPAWMKKCQNNMILLPASKFFWKRHFRLKKTYPGIHIVDKLCYDVCSGHWNLQEDHTRKNKVKIFVFIWLSLD